MERNILIDGDSQAAHTGRCLHRGVELYHRGVKRGLWRKTLATSHEYPKANFDEAEKMLTGYIHDPRNATKVICVEQEVSVTLPAWHTDTTGEEIVILGHLDQVREENGAAYVVDLKTSSTFKSGADLLSEYALQLTIYAMGAARLLGREVGTGFILRAACYALKKNEGVASPDDTFHKLPFEVKDAGLLLDELRKTVAEVRASEARPRPGKECVWCPAGHVGYCSALKLSYEEPIATVALGKSKIKKRITK